MLISVGACEDCVCFTPISFRKTAVTLASGYNKRTVGGQKQRACAPWTSTWEHSVTGGTDRLLASKTHPIYQETLWHHDIMARSSWQDNTKDTDTPAGWTISLGLCCCPFWLGRARITKRAGGTAVFALTCDAANQRFIATTHSALQMWEKHLKRVFFPTGFVAVPSM